MSKIKTLSLFSGAGGLDIGFHKSGFDIVACVEIESKYCRTLEVNRDEGVYLNGYTDIHNVDIRDFDVSPYKDIGIECVIGGPPCQTFSAAGRRSGGVIGTHDDRGQLYETYCEILDVIKPEVFVFENVYGLPGANGGEPWKEILASFSKHGYQIKAEVLDSADYGVPQHRERLIMVGTKSNNFRFPMPVYGPDSGGNIPLVSVLDAISDLQLKNERFSTGLGGLYGHLLPEVPEGLNYAFFTAEMGHPEPVFAWRSKFHDLLYKVDRNRPCRTIKANPGKFTGPFHWKNRHFTDKELKRLQTFPDDYRVIGSYSQIVEQIGNSVPPKLSEVVACAVKEQILRPRKDYTYPVRGEDFKSSFRQRQRERSQQFKTIAQKAIRKKYGDVREFNKAELTKPKVEKFYSLYASFFDRAVVKKKPKDKTHYLECSLTESSRHIRIDLDSNLNESSCEIRLEVNISGLNKYLPQIDTLTVSANLSSEKFIFNVWREIEVALISRSKFFTLIDIYGHYANRGDVVDISSKIKSEKSTLLLSVLDYFSQTENCGDFISVDQLSSRFETHPDDIFKVISEMRTLRFDIRTHKTHPIIGEGNILCTYPFPLLSRKAMVVSKVKLVRENSNEAETRQAPAVV